MGGRHTARALSPTSQVRYPWRATIRTLLSAAWGFIPLWPVIARELSVDAAIPWVAASLAVSAGVTRLTAQPAVEAWLNRYVPWLAADPRPEKGIGE